MNRKTFCISFFLRRVRTVKGMAPILARITVNGISKEVYTQCRTPVDKWDTAKGRATGRDKLAYEVNAYIDDFRAKVVEIYRTLQAEGFEGNTLEIKERLQSPGKQAKMFLEELTLYCEKRQKEVGVRITQLTSNKYYRLCRYLREYTKQEYKKTIFDCRRYHTVISTVSILIYRQLIVATITAQSIFWTACGISCSTACETSGLRKIRLKTTN